MEIRFPYFNAVPHVAVTGLQTAQSRKPRAARRMPPLISHPEISKNCHFIISPDQSFLRKIFHGRTEMLLTSRG